MITTISLVTIHQNTMLSFFLVMRTFRIYSLCSFYLWAIMLLTTVTMMYITSSWIIYFIPGSLNHFMEAQLTYSFIIVSCVQYNETTIPYILSVYQGKCTLNPLYLFHLQSSLLATTSFFLVFKFLFFVCCFFVH